MAFATLALALTSCRVNMSNMQNTNNTVTDVQLSGNNFKVIKEVNGEASHSYFLGIGGWGKKNVLLRQAKKNMYQNAELEGKSRAIINQTFDVEHSVVLLWNKVKVTSHGYVVEFK